MKVEIDTLIDIEDKELYIVFIPTIMLDKSRYSTSIYISWLCFNISITF